MPRPAMAGDNGCGRSGGPRGRMKSTNAIDPRPCPNRPARRAARCIFNRPQGTPFARQRLLPRPPLRYGTGLLSCALTGFQLVEHRLVGNTAIPGPLDPPILPGTERQAGVSQGRKRWSLRLQALPCNLHMPGMRQQFSPTEGIPMVRKMHNNLRATDRRLTK